MLILLLSLLLKTAVAMACDFAGDVNEVYSFSGPVTLAMQDLGLLKNKKVKGISVFHPIAQEDFAGVYFPGGLFLSHDTLKKFKAGLLFYDESRELRNILARYPDIRSVEIKNRGLTPMEVMLALQAQLKAHLHGCQLDELKVSLELKLNKLRGLVKDKRFYLFYLGLIQNEKLPEMLMVNDGIVKWMKQEKLIQTYPSELPYVSWSAKIMNELPKEVYRIGLKDSGNSMDIKLEKNKLGHNLTYPGALIPGRGQVDAMIYFFKD